MGRTWRWKSGAEEDVAAAATLVAMSSAANETNTPRNPRMNSIEIAYQGTGQALRTRLGSFGTAR